MTKISYFVKILLTIILSITFIYAIMIYFISLNYSFVNNTTHFLLMGINFLVILFLMIRLLKFKNIENEKKILWVVLFFIFSPSIFFYLWKTDDDFVKKSKIDE